MDTAKAPDGGRTLHTKKKRKIATLVLRWMLLALIAVFAVTSFFTYQLLTSRALHDADESMQRAIEDTLSDISLQANNYMLGVADQILWIDNTLGLPAIANMTEELLQDADGDGQKTESDITAFLQQYADFYSMQEISIISAEGIITHSSVPAYLGFNMADPANEQANAFYNGVRTRGSYVQKLRPQTFDAQIELQYAGQAIGGDCWLGAADDIIQIGFDQAFINMLIDDYVSFTAASHRVGSEGIILICRHDPSADSYTVYSRTDTSYFEEGSAEETEFRPEKKDFDPARFEPGERFESTISHVSYHCIYQMLDEYYFVAALPTAEVTRARNTTLLLTLAMEIIAFAVLIGFIYMLLMKLVVSNIRHTAATLNEIAGGNLNVKVDVHDSQEFSALSDDVNSTVDTLKGYIAEASARIDRELEIARVIQASSLPRVFPPYPDRTDFDIYASMTPAKEVGGDFYDFYMLDENRLAFLIADVSGKGITAAMFMMKAKTVLKGYVEQESDAAAAMTKANAALYDGNEAEMFVTCWMGVLDFAANKITFGNAGHNPPLVKRAGGRYDYFKTRANLVLGMRGTIRYRIGEMDFAPGDEIFLYTDGVTEATDGQDRLYGDAQLQDALNGLQEVNAQAICEAVKKDVDAFVGDAPQFDDITMLCLRRTPQSKITLVPDEQSIPTAEAFVEDTLADAGVSPKLTVKINIAVDEIYSNITRYSGASKAEIACEITAEKVRIIFTDDGQPYNPLEKEAPDLKMAAENREMGGFGIHMVKKIMDETHYRYENGKNVLTLIKKR